MRIVAFYNAHIGRAVAVLAGCIAVAVFLYGAFLLSAVAHAAGRTAAERQVQQLGAKVSALEAAYLSKTKTLSPQRAAELGLVAPVAVTTVYAGAAGLTLAGQHFRQ